MHLVSYIGAFIFFLFLRSVRVKCQDVPGEVAESKKLNQVEHNSKSHDSASEQLFFNVGMKKRWKDTQLKLENSIFKSRIEVLGEIFRTRVESLKRRTKVELVFLVDSSSSVGEENFRSEVKFVQKLVSDFTVSPTETRVAVVTFATSVECHINHLQENEERQKCSLLHKELPGVKYSGGNTHTLGALLEAKKILNSSRLDARQALFLITDGFSNNGYPVPVAQELKDAGVTIFTFGIKSGNVEELYKMSSAPPEEHSFLLESFSEFEALARRALHQDLKPGSYMYLKDPRLCSHLCASGSENITISKENGCCNNQSRCSCGTLTGHFACLCPPGYYGTGLMEEQCLPCPNGTYHDGSIPGDILVCRRCPDRNHETNQTPATRKKDCVCKDGFKADGEKCKVITCPVLAPPANGYFVKKSCSNVLHAACGVRCSIGYELSGSSVRLCQKNGTWSGVSPACLPKSCEGLKPVPNAEMVCTNEEEDYQLTIQYDSVGSVIKHQLTRNDSKTEENASTHKRNKRPETQSAAVLNYTIDTQCQFSCFDGFFLVGSKIRTCLPVMRWNGLQTTCRAITCPSLPLLPHGTITPENCTAPGTKHEFGSECQMSCKEGFILKGPKQRQCTGKYGTWTGKNTPSRCIDVEPPKFDCPINQTITSDEGVSFATTTIPLPLGTDNSGADPLIWSQPSVDENSKITLEIGITEILIQGTDGSENQNTCSFFIEVIDKESPKSINCDSPDTYFLTNMPPLINWTEPTFIDNSEKPITINKSHEFGVFPLGSTPVTYNATDGSGNQAVCVINITILENPCSLRPVPSNTYLNCSSNLNSNVTTCDLSCPSGYNFATLGNDTLENLIPKCTYNATAAVWTPDFFKDDFELFPECSATQTPDMITQTSTITLDSQDSSCQDLEQIYEELNHEINDIVKSKDSLTKVTSKCTEIGENDEGEEETNMIQTRSKRSSSKTIRLDVSVIESLTSESPAEGITGYKFKGEKLQNYFLMKDYIQSKGKRIPIRNVETSKEPVVTCRDGSIARGIECVGCPQGTFYNSTTQSCDFCPIGQFQNLEGQLRCFPCPDGYLTKRNHSKHATDCKKICRPGSYGRTKGRTSVALHPCIPCPLGFYQSLQGQGVCLKCPEGTNTIKKGAASIQQCVPKIFIDNVCLQLPCRNNATCSSHNGYPLCHCQEGFAGAFCQYEINPCDSSPCYNNGKCTHVKSKTFSCSCQQGFTGDICQYEINECDIRPCSNGGECVSIFNGFICDCPPGFYGSISPRETCNENLNECDTLQPCLNNATCVDLVNNYKCTCKDKFSGNHCEESACDLNSRGRCSDNFLETPKTSDPCSSVTCTTFMICKISHQTSLPECVCQEGFRGDSCTEVINPQIILTFPKCSVTDYISVDFPAKEINELTACLWVQTADKFNYGTLFSYATLDEFNAFTFTDYNGFVLYVKNQRIITDLTANDGHWHFVCVSWQSDGGSWKIHLNGALHAHGQGLSNGSAISGNGIFVVGQEQDSYGGGFNEVESFVGKMTYLDVWDRVLTDSEIQEMSIDCKPYNGSLMQWTTLLANVRGNVKISPSDFCKNCGSLTFLYKGVIAVQNKEIKLAKYECDEGFYIKFESGEEHPDMGSRIWYRRCMKHGDWEPNPPKCARVSCGFPGYFPHGFISGSSYLYEDVITYRCTSGYTMRGTSTRICQSNGTWSGEMPFCKGSSTDCQQLLAPRHGSMFLHDSTQTALPREVGNQVEFTCDGGYSLEGSSILTCLDTGEWDIPVPSCTEITCPKPNKIPNLIINSSKVNFPVGYILNLRCTTTKHEITVTCGLDGSWNITTDVCDIRCWKKPPHPNHGYLIDDGRKNSRYKENDIISISCRHGYKLLGENFIVCSSDGAWRQKKRTICEAVECSQPMALPHAHPTADKTYRYGDRVVYECLPGFQNHGDLTVRCEAESRWSRIRGTCTRISCGKPGVSSHLELEEVTTFLYTDRIQIKCPPGKRLAENAEKEIMCQANGQWTEASTCT